MLLPCTQTVNRNGGQQEEKEKLYFSKEALKHLIE